MSYKISGLSRASINLFDFSFGMDGSIDEKIAKPTVAKLSLNFKTNSGALCDAEGVKKLSFDYEGASIIPSLPIGVFARKSFFYKRYDSLNEVRNDRILVYASDNKMYEYIIGSSISLMSEIANLTFSIKPSSVCYKYNGDDVIIFSSEEGLKIYDGENVTIIADAPDITSMCIHSERLFVTTKGEGSALWYSDDFDPTDWYVSLDRAGFIDLQDGRGSLVKVISFNDYVYIFRSYGISRLTAYSEQSEFYVTGLATSSGRIYANSIVDCGNRIIYLAEDGFYSFDGLYSSRILKGYDCYLKGIDNSNAVGKYYNGSLYMLLKLKINDAIRSVLFVYDFSSGGVSILNGVDICDFELASTDNFSVPILICGDDETLCTLSERAELFGVPLVKKWISNFNDFGIASKKVLRRISLYSSGQSRVVLYSENGSVTLNVGASLSRQSYRVGLKGDTFSVQIQNQNLAAKISKLVLYFDYFKE